MYNDINITLMTIIFFRWTINLALTTANQMFKSSNPFDSQDLVEVASFICIVTINVPSKNEKNLQLQPGVSYGEKVYLSQ